MRRNRLKCQSLLNKAIRHLCQHRFKRPVYGSYDVGVGIPDIVIMLKGLRMEPLELTLIPLEMFSDNSGFRIAGFGFRILTKQYRNT